MPNDHVQQIDAHYQYVAGAFDALAAILATMARHQGLELRSDLEQLENRLRIYHTESEASRRNGYENVLDVFRHAYGQPYP